MRIRSDWHIHSRNSCDEASLVIADLVAAAGPLGLRDYGITDHLHTPYNLPDLERSRAEFDALAPDPHFHFGVEVSCVSEWELGEVREGRAGERPVYGIRSGGPAGASPAIALTPEHMEHFGIEYVVAGTHWPLYVPFEREAVIQDYHRQNMFLACHPLVDIVAHPWWWMGHWQDEDGMYRREPWLDDFRKIPAVIHDEFAAAAMEHDTKVEINVGACLLSSRYTESFRAPYLEYLVDLRERGVQFTIASDCHSSCYAPAFEEAATLLTTAGFQDTDFWRLPPREVVD